MVRVTGPGPSLRSQWLGERMRRIRKRLRIPQQEAADHIRRNNSMLGRYESGEIPFRRNDVVDLLDFYGVSSEIERNGLLQLCDDVWRKDWWDSHTDDFGQDFIDVPWLESRAERICVYQHIIVHGLLQTREYAESLIRFGSKERTPEVQISKWTDLRMERQHVLHAAAARATTASASKQARSLTAPGVSQSATRTTPKAPSSSTPGPNGPRSSQARKTASSTSPKGT